MTSAKETIETPIWIEPARLEETPEAIADAIADLSAASAALGARLHTTTAANLADLVRLMNCYYSNLIEGHHTGRGISSVRSSATWTKMKSGATSSSKRPPMSAYSRKLTGSLRQASCPSRRPATLSAGCMPSSIATRQRQC